jgi:hypothetical protein
MKPPLQVVLQKASPIGCTLMDTHTLNVDSVVDVVSVAVVVAVVADAVEVAVAVVVVTVSVLVLVAEVVVGVSESVLVMSVAQKPQVMSHV